MINLIVLKSVSNICFYVALFNDYLMIFVFFLQEFMPRRV